MPLAVSPEGLALVKRLEGFRAEAASLDDGRAVYGYGHVAAMAPNAQVSEKEAEKLLKADLAPVEEALNRLLLTRVSQPQFDALASFTFSIGVEAFSRSDVLRRLNAGEPIAAACAMDAWRKSAVNGEPMVLDALVRRRAAEKAVFLDVSALVPVASALARPVIDHAVAILGSPTKVTALPTAAVTPTPPQDETVRRLAGILGRDPNTAHALMPPPAPPEDEEEDVLVLNRPLVSAPAAADVTRLSLFGLGGAALLAGGVVALNNDRNILFLLLTAPGAVMLLSAAWRLFKDTSFVQRWSGVLRL